MPVSTSRSRGVRSIIDRDASARDFAATKVAAAVGARVMSDRRRWARRGAESHERRSRVRRDAGATNGPWAAEHACRGVARAVAGPAVAHPRAVGTRWPRVGRSPRRAGPSADVGRSARRPARRVLLRHAPDRGGPADTLRLCLRLARGHRRDPGSAARAAPAAHPGRDPPHLTGDRPAPHLARRPCGTGWPVHLGPGRCAAIGGDPGVRIRHRGDPRDLPPADADDACPRSRPRPCRARPELPHLDPADRRGDGAGASPVVSAARAARARRRAHPGRSRRRTPGVATTPR
jgi:hypothetical protein